MAGFPSSSWVNTVPFLACVTACMHVCIMHTHRIFFKHVSVDGYLGCFPIWLLWIILTWTQECRYLFDILFAFLFLDVYPEVELLGHMAVLIFFRNLCTVFHNGYTSLHPHHQYTTVCFFHILTTCYLCFCFFSNQGQVMIEKNQNKSKYSILRTAEKAFLTITII